jgi:desulfoferrodoxin (superoxide reductase-like protein)
VDLKPSDKPEATFEGEFESLDDLMAKEHCNLHGTWQSDKEEMVV